MQKRINLLCISLSEGWGSQERTLISTCLYLKEHSQNRIDIKVLCTRNSALYYQANQVGIPQISFSWKVNNLLKKTKFVFKLRQLLKKNEIDVVHLFDMHIFWPVCYALYQNPKIPLVLSIFSGTQDLNKYIWHKWLARRVDLCLSLNEEMSFNFLQYIPVRQRKIEIMDYEYYLQVDARQSSLTKKTSGEYNIGTCLEGDFKSWVYQDTFFFAISSLIEKWNFLNKKNKIKILFYCRRNWNEFALGRSIKQQAKNLGLDGVIEFIDHEDIFLNKSILDLWIDLPIRSSMTTFLGQALYQGVPVLCLRNSTSRDLFTKVGPVGETFLYKDSRELREKCLMILSELKTFKQDVKKYVAAWYKSRPKIRVYEYLEQKYSRLIEVRQRIQLQHIVRKKSKKSPVTK